MTFRCRPSWAIVALGFTFAACGAAADTPNKLDLTTPGAHTGAPLEATPAPTAVPNVTPAATPGVITPRRKPVTSAEKRVIQGWSDELRHGRVTAASRYFAIPSAVVNLTATWDVLRSRDAIKDFNRALPCGAKLMRTRRSTDSFVVGIFRLTERPGGECGTGTGQVAAVAFLIENNHIKRWVRVDDAALGEDPSATPTPTPSDDAGVIPTLS